MSLRKTLLAASVLATPLMVGHGAVAQNFMAPVPGAVSGLYIAGGLGWNHAQPNDLTATGGNRSFFNSLTARSGGRVHFDEGYAGVISLGWGFGNGFRTEVEGSYRENDVSKVGGFGGNTQTSSYRNAGGRLHQYGVMANAFYDFNISGFPVIPYVGGGIGYMWTDYDGVRGTRNQNGGATVRINGDDGSFAYQGIAGAALPIAGVPGLSLTLEYRYMNMLETNHGGRITSPTGVQLARGGFDSDSGGNHSVLIGARYAFGVAPPPPPVVEPMAPVAQAPAPARTYLVFFDFDRADLTDRARQIIADAANASRNTQTTRIEVSGHADRSGTPQYNQALSLRRANAVAAELERRGVDRSAMSIQAFGESRPLVQTADGVREPQNRRVEIVLR